MNEEAYISHAIWNGLWFGQRFVRLKETERGEFPARTLDNGGEKTLVELNGSTEVPLDGKS